MSWLVTGGAGYIGSHVVREFRSAGIDAVVLDDLTPCEQWPPVFHGRVDTLREEWLTDERFTTVEVMVASDAATLIATRR